MAKVWEIQPKISDNLFEQLLYNRGLKTEKEKEEFLYPRLENYQAEFDLPGIKTAKKRIKKAIEDKELIVIFGDYDADGVCGAAVFYLGLTSLGARVLPYIPHREKEGYGLNKLGLLYAKDQGAGLVITVDNGIVSAEAAGFAKELGLDLIITDHHLPGEIKPEALAIVHSTAMCGASVGWSLIKELTDRQVSEELLDLAGMATIADMVPLLGVNRALAKVGLEKLNNTKRVGLKALVRESGLILGDLDARQVSISLCPKLNAIGRLEHALDALRLLCTKDVIKASKLARVLKETNDRQGKLTNEAIVQAKIIISEQKMSEKSVLVLHSDKWIPGIISLMAWRLCEEYLLPTVVIAQGEAISRGSVRAPDGLNVVETIRQHADLLVDVGGHPKSAGFSIATAKIAAFKDRLEEALAAKVWDQNGKIVIDAIIQQSQLTKKTVTEINQLEPTGVANPRPLFATMNARVSDIRTVGNGQHLKFKAEGIDAIAFGMGSFCRLLQEGQLLNVAYYLEIDRYNGSEKLQMKIIDLQSI